MKCTSLFNIFAIQFERSIFSQAELSFFPLFLFLPFPMEVNGILSMDQGRDIVMEYYESLNHLP